MDNKMEKIVLALKTKATVKQRIYRNTLQIFGHMKEIAAAIATGLTEVFNKVDENVVIEYKDINAFEFHLKFSGDLLIFTMHSNVLTMPAEHIVLKSPYIQENPIRAYFGEIMVYNFMADSLKYNRLQDPGFLMARMMLNVEGHFYIEGVRQLAFLYPDIAENVINPTILGDYMQSAILFAIEQDLMAPSFAQIQVVTLGKKIANQMVHSGNKVGFVMNHQREEQV